jgi:hypothetical protein
VVHVCRCKALDEIERIRIKGLTSGPKPSHLHQMKFNSPIRIAVRDLLIPSTVLATLCCGASVSHAQSTKSPTPFAVSTPPGLASSPNEPKLSVDYVAGELVVTATNASLNQILRQVSRSIGMKITGSVADERVYGQYGPSTPSVVLATLLDGTAINMLLVDDAKGATELILTPRNGGPTPPSPSASRPKPEDHPAPEAPQRHPATEKPPAAAPTAPRRGFGHHPTQGAPSDANAGDNSSV